MARDKWAELVHPETDGRQRVPDRPNVIAMWAELGWVRAEDVPAGDPDQTAVIDDTATALDSDPGAPTVPAPMATPKVRASASGPATDTDTEADNG